MPAAPRAMLDAMLCLRKRRREDKAVCVCVFSDIDCYLIWVCELG